MTRYIFLNFLRDFGDGRILTLDDLERATPQEIYNRLVKQLKRYDVPDDDLFHDRLILVALSDGSHWILLSAKLKMEKEAPRVTFWIL